MSVLRPVCPISNAYTATSNSPHTTALQHTTCAEKEIGFENNGLKTASQMDVAPWCKKKDWVGYLQCNVYAVTSTIGHIVLLYN